YQHAAPPGPVSGSADARKEAKGRVDRVPDIPIGSGGHQTACRRVRRHVITAPTEGEAGPQEKQNRRDLQRYDQGRRQEERLPQEETNDAGGNASVADKRQSLEHTMTGAQLLRSGDFNSPGPSRGTGRSCALQSYTAAGAGVPRPGSLGCAGFAG